jgi:hypothetical protein
MQAVVSALNMVDIIVFLHQRNYKNVEMCWEREEAINFNQQLAFCFVYPILSEHIPC